MNFEQLHHGFKVTQCCFYKILEFIKFYISNTMTKVFKAVLTIGNFYAKVKEYVKIF